MNDIYPVAKLGHQVLIINKADLPFIGREQALEVKCIKVDLQYKKIDPLIELERHLKFNPWEETSEEERTTIFHYLNSKFSQEEILGKIVYPLTESLIQDPR